MRARRRFARIFRLWGGLAEGVLPNAAALSESVWALQKELFVAKPLLKGVGRYEALEIEGLLW